MKKTGVVMVCLILAGVLLWLQPWQDTQTEVNYRLKWLFNTSVAGDIWADEGGFFEANGLAVAVKEGSPEKNAINELELGHAQFGVASADQVIRALDRGADIVVIAQLFQVNPMQWIYRAEKGEIRTPADLKGRKTGITYGGNDEIIMKTLLASAGIREQDVMLTGVRFDFTPFLKKEVDVWPVYRNSQGVILEDRLAKGGETALFFNPADHGVRFVANSVVTTRSLLETDPDLVKRFLGALLRGWEAAMAPANEARVLEAVQKRNTGLQGAVLKEQLEETRRLVKPGPDVRIGTIDKDAWKQTEAVLVREKQVKKAVQIESRLVHMAGH